MWFLYIQSPRILTENQPCCNANPSVFTIGTIELTEVEDSDPDPVLLFFVSCGRKKKNNKLLTESVSSIDKLKVIY